MTHDIDTDDRTLPETRADAHAMAVRFAWLIRIVLALAAGAAAALAHPPFGFLPGLLGYALLMLLAERTPRVRGAFLVGWLAGFAYFLIGCWWVAEAFMVNPEQAWMAPFAASLLPALLAFFWAGACAIYRRMAMPGLFRALVFAALFCAFEQLRGWILTGLPWNPAGASWAAGSAMSQFASIGGVYGLSLVTVAAVAMIGLLGGPGPRKHRIGMAAGGVALLAALGVYGMVRLSQPNPPPTQTVVRIVQADVQQEAKWTPENFDAIVARYINLTGKPGAAVPDIVVWPEGALPTTANDAFAPGSPIAAGITGALQPGQTLLAGLSRGELGPDGEARYYNSLFALHDEGAGVRVIDVYDKYRLVPFGEFLPLGEVMSAIGFRSLVHVAADFSPGPRPAPISLPNAPDVQPLICYESLYPGFTPGGRGRPQWIANVSNDAWFGRTSGPLQHLNLASYRALETGLPVVRATPTGVSALIGPKGGVIGANRLDPGESGVIDARLPAPLPPTVYGWVGDWPGRVIIVLVLGLAVLARRNVNDVQKSLDSERDVEAEG